MMNNDQWSDINPLKKPMERSKRTHGGNPWAPLEMNGVKSSRHPSAEVMAERLVQMESGKCFPEVRKAIQSKQFLKHLEKGSKFGNPKVHKIKGKVNT